MRDRTRDDAESLTVNVDGRRIGRGERAFVIAEAGVNHDGSVERALEMVDVAADAGADAVKFQIFSAADLVTAKASTAPYQMIATGKTSQRAMLSKLELSYDSFEQIMQGCKQRSVMFLATPFGGREVDRLVALGVRAIKMASTDLVNHVLLTHVARTGLPLILSAGASTAHEIRCTIDLLFQLAAGDRLILLHCVSQYPTPVSAINLRAVQALRREYRVPCGLSDHTTSMDVGAWAVAAGACIVEKHFTLDKRADGPDHAMSLSPDELAAYITRIRQVESALGDGQVGMTSAEAAVRAVATKSVVSSVDIRKGQVLTAGMLTLKRPGGGIPPGDLARVIGLRSRADIPSDTTLSWDMVR